jgi:C4-dicarboxylate transporter DctM subunit
VLQGMTGRNILTIGVHAFPFFVLMCVAVVLIVLFPQIALWLPSTMLDAR